MTGLPRAKTVKAVADYFSVSINYLKGDDDTKTIQNLHDIIRRTHIPATIVNRSEMRLSEEENELLSIFEKLSIINRAKLLVFANELQSK